MTCPPCDEHALRLSGAIAPDALIVFWMPPLQRTLPPFCDPHPGAQPFSGAAALITLHTIPHSRSDTESKTKKNFQKILVNIHWMMDWQVACVFGLPAPYERSPARVLHLRSVDGPR